MNVFRDSLENTLRDLRASESGPYAPPNVSKASSNSGLATSNLPWRMAAAAVRYSQRTLSLGGPSAIIRGPSTRMSPVIGIFGAGVAQPVKSNNAPRENKVATETQRR